MALQFPLLSPPIDITPWHTTIKWVNRPAKCRRSVKLIPLDPWTPKLRIVLDKLPVMVGRSADADVHLTDLWVSRRHCEIGELNGTLTVRDLESRHGTFVNGLKVDQALLMPGDQLTLGISRFQVQYKRGTAKQTAAGEREAVTQE